MVLTRWSQNTGALVTPVNANIFLGKFQIPVPSGTSEFNVWSGINADLGAILLLRPNIDVLKIAWSVTISLVASNVQSISTFGGNPPRAKLGSITYNQGSFSLSYEPINYFTSLLERQEFLFAEGLLEPSVGVISLPPVPEAFQYISAPGVGALGGSPPYVRSFGATRANFLLNAGIIGIADISYTATDIAGTAVPIGNSLVVSEL